MITLIYPCLRHQAVGNGQQSVGATRLPAPMPMRHCQRQTPRKPFRASLAWWFQRGAHTRSHSELGRQTPQRPWYFVSRRGRVGRCQACKARNTKPLSQTFSPQHPAPTRWTKPSHPAGWSSPVARQAHNLKVVSSNLAPATKYVPRPVPKARGVLRLKTTEGRVLAGERGGHLPPTGRVQTLVRPRNFPDDGP